MDPGELQRKQQEAEAAIEAEKLAVVAPAVALLCQDGWTRVKGSKELDISLEVARVSGSPKKAVRVCCRMKCSMETFLASVLNHENAQLYEPSLKSNAVVAMTPSFTVLHTVYNSTRIVSGRDFCTRTSHHPLGKDQLQAVLQAISSVVSTPAAGDVQGHAIGAVNDTSVPEEAGLIRGIVQAFGYAVLQWEPASICVVNVINTDPRGNLPAFLVESTYPMHVDKMDRVRRICEAHERVRHYSGQHTSIKRASLKLGDDDVVAERPSSTPPPEQADSNEGAPGAEAAGKDQQDAAALSPVDNNNDLEEPPVQTAVSDAVAEVIVEASVQELQAPVASSVPSEEAAAQTLIRPADQVDTIPEPQVLTDAQIAVFKPVADLHLHSDWKVGKTLSDCLLEESVVSYAKVKGIRISTDVHCSLATLEAFLSDEHLQRKVDPTIDEMAIWKEPNGVLSVYTSYKSPVKFVKPRDFCSETCRLQLQPSVAHSLGFTDVTHDILIQGAVNSRKVPEKKTHIRGTIFVFGYLALANAADTQLRLYTMMCVDPGGSIPKWVVDAAKEEGCKKLAATRYALHQLQERRSTNATPRQSFVPARTQPEHVAPVLVQPVPQTDQGEPRVATSVNVESEEVPVDLAASPTQLPEEFDEEQQQLDDFYQEEVEQITGNFVQMHTKLRWEVSGHSKGFRVETAEVAGLKHRAIKLSGELLCTLESFIALASDPSAVSRFDPTVAKTRTLASPPYGTILQTVYRKDNRLPVRDTCTLTVQKLLSQEDGAKYGLYTEGIRSSAYVIASIESKDLGPQSGIGRCAVAGSGFIAVATPPEAQRVRIFSLNAVDFPVSASAKITQHIVEQLASSLTRMNTLVRRERCDKAPVEAETETPATSSEQPPDDSVEQPQSSEATAAERCVDIAVILQRSRSWLNKRRVGRCDVEEASWDDQQLQVMKVSAEYLCSLGVFEQAVNNLPSITRYDTAVEEYDCETFAGDVERLELQMKSTSKFIPGKRLSFVRRGRWINYEEGKVAGLFTSGVTCAAFIKAGGATSDDRKTPLVHTFSFVAIATPPTAERIRVAHYVCIDPAGSGKKIPSKLWEAAVKEASNRVTFLGVICQQLEQRRIDRLRQLPAEDEATDSPVAKGQDVSEGAPQVVPRELEQAPTPKSDAAKEDEPVLPPQQSGSVVESPQLCLCVQPVRDPPQQREVRLPPGQHELVRPLLRLYMDKGWKMGKVVEGCLMEECPVSYSKLKALRISTTVKCSLETFDTFMQDEALQREVDPQLDTVRLVKETADSKTIYTNYKQQIRMVSARDFCSTSCRLLVTPEMVKDYGLELTAPAMLQAAVNSSAVGPQKGFVRGTIHVFGYLALAGSLPGETADNLPGIKLINIVSIEPGGGLPNWLVEAAKAENCKKLAHIRAVLERLQKS